MKMCAVFPTWAVIILLVAVPSHCRLDDVTVSQTMYLTAVVDLINAEYTRLGKDVEEFNPMLSNCTTKLNASSEACQACLKTVECGSTVAHVIQVVDPVQLDPVQLEDRRFDRKRRIYLANSANLLKDKLDNIKSKLGKVDGNFAKTVGKNFVDGLLDVAGEVGKKVIDGLKGSIRGLKNLGERLGKGAKELGEGLGEKAKSVGSFLKNAAKKVGSGVKGVVEKIRSGVSSAAKAIVDTAKGVGKGVKDVVEGIGAAKVVVEAVKSVGKKAKELVEKISPRVSEGVKTLVDTVKKKIAPKVSGAARVVGEAVKSVGKKVKEVVEKIAPRVSDGARAVVDTVKKVGQKVKDTVEKIAPKVSGAAKKVGEAARSIGRKVKDKVSGAAKKVGEAAKSVGRKVQDTVKRIAPSVSRAAEKVGKAAKSVVKGLKGFFRRGRRSVPTPNDRVCMLKCIDCTPFLSGEITAARTVCGADVVDRNASLTAEVAMFDGYFNDVNEAKLDLLTAIKVNSTSGLLTTVTALVRGQYRTFSTTVKFEAFDPTSMYKNLAMYIYKNYLGL